MHKKISLTLALLLIITVLQASGQEIEPPRSAIIPYPTRAEALVRDTSSSSYVIVPAEWKTEEDEYAVTMRSTVKIPRKWGGRTMILRIEDAKSVFSVAVNDSQIGFSQLGVVRTEFNITPYLVDDYNDIEIVLYKNAATEAIENHRKHKILDAGNVTILSQPAVRVRDIVYSANVEPDGRGVLSAGIAMKSRLRNPAEYVVHYELLAPDGTTIDRASKDLVTGWMSEDTLRFSTVIPNVKKWNHETPHLYTIVVRSFHEGRNAEFVSADIGFRAVSHKDNSLLINGIEVPLVSRIAQYEESGEATRATLTALKQEGVNCVITPGYPQPDVFYSLCDSLGVYVCEVADIDTRNQSQEITVGGNPTNDPEWADMYVSRAKASYHSAAIHPSVVAFAPAGQAGNGYCLYESYLAMKSIENNRPIVYPDAEGQWNSDNIDLGFESTRDYKTPISISGTIDSQGATIAITNNLLLTEIDGYVSYDIKQKKKVKSSAAKPIKIAANNSATIEITADELSAVKSGLAIDVYVYIEKPLYDNGSITYAITEVQDMHLIGSGSF